MFGSPDAQDEGVEVVETLDGQDDSLEAAACDDGGESEALVGRTIPFDEGRDDDLDENDRQYEEQMAQATARRHDDEDESSCFPLRPKSNPGKPLPDNALPTRCRKIAEALVIRAAGTYDVAVMLLLSFLSLLLQGHADVEMWGQARPLSLITLIIAGSGSKKTRIYERLVEPINAYVRQLWAEHAEMAKRAKQRDKRLNEEPEDPPVVFVQNTTEAAIVRFLSTSLGFMGLFVDEAAVFLGSFAMQHENFLAMIGLQSKLSDGSQVIVHRAGTGQRIIDRKRFSVMLASPRGPFNGLLGNPIVRQQGFLSRALIVAPRNERRDEATPEEIEWATGVLKEYDRFMTKILHRNLPLAPGTRNDLEPPVLVLTPEAKAMLRDFNKEINAFRDGLPEDDPAHDLSNKSAELGGRIGGLCALFENPNTREVDAVSMQYGITVSRHCMREKIRAALPAVSNPSADLAERIGHWLAKNGIGGVTRSELQKACLGRKLTVAEFDPALKLLIDSGWVIEEATKRKRGGGRIKHTYRLTRAARRELGLQD